LRKQSFTKKTCIFEVEHQNNTYLSISSKVFDHNKNENRDTIIDGIINTISFGDIDQIKWRIIITESRYTL